MKLIRYIPLLFLVFLPLWIATTFAETNTPTAIESVSNWENAMALTGANANTPNGAQRPVISVAPNGNLIIVYLKQLSGNDLDTDPFYRKSTDGGKTWTVPARIYSSIASSRQVDVVFDNSNRAHAVWTENNNQLWYARDDVWASNGAKQPFASAQILIESPQLAVGPNGALHLVWFRANINDENILYSSSTNGGANWSTPKDISNPTGASLGASQSPAIAIDSSNRVHVVWEEQVGGTQYQINYSRRETNGVWSTPVGISTVVTGITSAREPKIIIQGTKVIVAFEDRSATNQQTLYYLECSSNCTTTPVTTAAWKSQLATVQAYTVKDTDPSFLVPQIVSTGRCNVLFFSGIIGSPSSNNEKIFLSDSCDNFSSNPMIQAVNNSLGANDRAIKPSAIAVNNWTIFVAYERKGTTRSDIYFVKSKPALYLPVIIQR
ncbi:MAG: sialidase family protein [Candidatus Promineifilaceae bacterium]